MAGHAGYTLLPLDIEQAIEFSSLPGIKDPMDRVVVSAARIMDAIPISSDEGLAEWVSAWSGIEILRFLQPASAGLR